MDHQSNPIDHSTLQRFLTDTVWPVPISDWGYVDEDRSVSFQVFKLDERGDHGTFLICLITERCCEKITNYFPNFKSGLVFLSTQS